MTQSAYLSSQGIQPESESNGSLFGRVIWPVLMLGVPGSISAFIWLYGSDFYLLDIESRVDHVEFRSLSPGGLVGHGYGIAGTALFLTNLTYLLRRRFARVRLGRMKLWLEIHAITGLLGGALILFHSAFQLRSGIASTGFWCVVVLMVTGIIGRFLKALVPHPNLTKLALNVGLLNASLPGLGSAMTAALESVQPSVIQGRRTLLKTLRMLQIWRQEAALRRAAVIDAANQFAAESNVIISALKPQIDECAGIAHKEVRAHAADALLRVWRGFHRFAALLMTFAVIIHVGIAWYYGFRWIWSE